MQSCVLYNFITTLKFVEGYKDIKIIVSNRF